MKLPERFFESTRPKERHAQLAAAYAAILTVASIEGVLNIPPALWVPIAGAGIAGIWAHAQIAARKS